MVKWFRSFSEVSGIGYKGNPSVYCPQLPEHATLPKSGSYEIAGVRHEYSSWPMLFGTGTTSASPVKQWTTHPRSGESPAQTRLRQLYESLELPGELLDYHFAIQGCCSELWRLRLEEPWVFAEIERLCWLDIRLIQTHPDIVQVKNEREFLLITTMQHLMALRSTGVDLPSATTGSARTICMPQAGLLCAFPMTCFGSNQRAVLPNCNPYSTGIRCSLTTSSRSLSLSNRTWIQIPCSPLLQHPGVRERWYPPISILTATNCI